MKNIYLSSNGGRSFSEVLVHNLVEHQKRNGFTTDKYWDCNCEDNYIQSTKTKKCDLCGACEYEQPSSITDEVIKAGLPL